jgi:GrpB-like predicted nucleotidyltransferase (UPF0157 family)
LVGTSDIGSLIEKIKQMGFFQSDKSKTAEYLFFASKEGETGVGDIHIHVSLLGTDRYEDFITLKEYLLNNSTEVKKYSDRKHALAKIAARDRQEYKRLKGLEVDELIRQAREWKKEKRKTF